jgi:hypothetical protein
MKSGWKLNLVRVLVLIAVIGLTAFLYINRNQVAKLEVLGYPGIFLISLLSNATLILPVPVFCSLRQWERSSIQFGWHWLPGAGRLLARSRAIWSVSAARV